MKAKALYDCTADDEGELSFKEGDIIVDVTESKEEDWYEGRVQGTSIRGLFPFNYAELIFEQQEHQNSLTSSRAIPDKNTSNYLNRVAFSSSVSPPNSTLSSTWSVISNKDSFAAQDNNELGDVETSSHKSLANNNNSHDAFERAMQQQQPMSSTKAIGGAAGGSKQIKIDSQQKPYISANSSQLLKEKPSIGNKKPIAHNNNMLVMERLPLQHIAPSTVNAASSTVPSRVRSLSTSISSVNNFGQDDKETDKLPSLYKPQIDLRSSPPINIDNNDTHKMNNSDKVLPIIRTKQNSNSIKSIILSDDRPTMIQHERIKTDNNPTIENEEDIEDVDGYQLVRPSHIRQQQATSAGSMITPKAMPTLARINLKQTPKAMIKPASNTNSILPPPPSLKSGSLNPTSSNNKLMGIPCSNNPAPRLPSRPVSTASRRSRSSRTSSTKTMVPTSKPIATNVKLPPEPKPKPSQFETVAANNSLTQRSKNRSVSNPPPIQPKPFIPGFSNKLDTQTQNKPDIPPKLPSTSTVASKTIPPVPAKSITKEYQQWQQRKEGSESTNESNVKPSEILRRTRSKSNCAPQSTSNSNDTPVLPVRSFISTVNSTATAMTLEKGVLEATGKTKRAPPPLPPSRPVPRNNSKTPARYEALFDAIHDDGYVDGQTAKIIWKRSKVAEEELSKIWQHCDPNGSGLLDKNMFIQGMREIDALLGLSR